MFALKKMNEQLPLKTTQKLIELRNLLDRISQISWSFSVLNKRHPISEVQLPDVDGLIEAYEKLLSDAQEVVVKWQN